MFERKTGLTVKTISVGTGQALALAARGEADVNLAHAPGVERMTMLDWAETGPPVPSSGAPTISQTSARNRAIMLPRAYRLRIA